MSVDQKKRWPEYIQELVFTYNCTPHSSTGFSPFFIFMGQEPTLPIDLMLGLTDLKTTPSSELDPWVEQHQRMLKSASESALAKMQERSATLCKRSDTKANDKGIPVGTRVLLRSHPQGRNKMEDYWKATPYKVVSHPLPNVYKEQLADGTGPLKHISHWRICTGGELSTGAR